MLSVFYFELYFLFWIKQNNKIKSNNKNIGFEKEDKRREQASFSPLYLSRLPNYTISVCSSCTRSGCLQRKITSYKESAGCWVLGASCTGCLSHSADYWAWHLSSSNPRFQGWWRGVGQKLTNAPPMAAEFQGVASLSLQQRVHGGGEALGPHGFKFYMLGFSYKDKFYASYFT